ncbi:lipoma-preferred partner homolog [Lingula anatina]|uniref:Lipoma-preferred partner homolog n=1 Tax=Lingula anatina TaxID=7574 RepID=A0A1S3JSB3_LINAN|nr:lipoma-preferred partner homolog [Lingula anatina]|eukprot:XP_013412899.1 lipoma-preferred partner homolog [Lingula anatina]
MTTQARLMRELGVPDQGGGKKPGPAVAPKPKFRSPQMSPQPQEYRAQQFRTASYQYQDEFPPPPPPQTNFSSPQPFYRRYETTPQDDFPPPPPVVQDYGGTESVNDTKKPYEAHAVPQPASYQQTTTTRPTYTASSTYAGAAGPVLDGRSPFSSGSVSPSYPASSYSSYRSTPQSYEDHYASDPPPPAHPGGSNYSQPLRAEPAKTGSEAEVDALTNLLVKSMEASSDPDFFGMCAKCKEKVSGADNGCTAMEQVFHIGCFTCATCGAKLRGQPFYAMEAKPYCEGCYMNTLEKCSVCSKAITHRILRATGKPYHPECFTCVVCNKSLDGIPFTVDATNQIHCIEDFHRKFAPRCCVCQQPIMPDNGQEETVRIVAMDKSFHVNCYRCEDCGLILSSEAEGRGCYPLDDHLLCKNCNALQIQAMTSKMTTEL